MQPPNIFLDRSEISVHVHNSLKLCCPGYTAHTLLSLKCTASATLTNLLVDYGGVRSSRDWICYRCDTKCMYSVSRQGARRRKPSFTLAVTRRLALLPVTPAITESILVKSGAIRVASSLDIQKFALHQSDLPWFHLTECVYHSMLLPFVC